MLINIFKFTLLNPKFDFGWLRLGIILTYLTSVRSLMNTFILRILYKLKLSYLSCIALFFKALNKNVNYTF